MPRDPELKAKHLQAIAELGIKSLKVVKAIRQTCFECSNDSWKQVKDCEHFKCPFWAFRFGYNPFTGKKNNNFLTALSNNANSVKKVHLFGGTFSANTKKPTITMPKKENAPESLPVRRLPIVKIAILKWIINRLPFFNQFHGSDIERIPVSKFCTAETRRRRFRELNSDYNIAHCISPNKSLYEITVGKDRLLEILNMLRRHEYGKSHANSETGVNSDCL